VTAIAAIACGGPPPRAPNPTRALDERRAVAIAIRAFRAESEQPIPGRTIDLGDGKLLKIDVGGNGRKFGVAYVTAQERTNLGQALPARDPARGDALQLTTGVGPDSDARILVLYDTEYLYDDQVGTEHEASTITAERKLERDIRDFVVRAHTERWP
jgi:hypothetical protein